MIIESYNQQEAQQKPFGKYTLKKEWGLFLKFGGLILPKYFFHKLNK
jgi:hypothetical protein